MDNDSKKFVVPLGMISLITILVFIILLLFTVLTVSQVSNDTQLTEKTLIGITEYYQAETKAELKLANIHNILKNEFYDDFEKEILSQNINIIESENSTQVIVEYKEPINKQKDLFVQIVFNLNSDSYEKLCWKVVSL